MKKAAKIKKYKISEDEVSEVSEPVMEYQTVKRFFAPEDFTFRQFEKISRRVAFTQKEWADILHLSERTLQRYAKDNKSFEGIYVDRIIHIEELVSAGLETFINADAFYRWLKKEKHVLGQTLNFQSLYTTRGIQDVIDQLGRIQYGVYT
ncbi:MAG: antitoxin Xre-like helix-turn-helix domain-containing protein [Parafilimonas sp.]